MQGKFSRNAAYPLTCNPRKGGTWEVVNLATGESHGLFDSVAAASTELDKQRDLLQQRYAAAGQSEATEAVA